MEDFPLPGAVAGLNEEKLYNAAAVADDRSHYDCHLNGKYLHLWSSAYHVRIICTVMVGKLPLLSFPFCPSSTVLPCYKFQLWLTLLSGLDRKKTGVNVQYALFKLSVLYKYL